MGWTKSDNVYVAFASDMESFLKHSVRNVRCPKCRDELTKKQLWANPVRHGEEPMAEFKVFCSHCEAHMRIFND